MNATKSIILYFASLATIFVFSKVTFANDSCRIFLQPKAEFETDYKYRSFEGPRENNIRNRLSIDDKSNRLFLRGLMSEALVPIFNKVGQIRNVRLAEVSEWLVQYKALATYQMVHKILPKENYVSLSFKDLAIFFDKTFGYRMEFFGFWSDREVREFEVGLDLDQAYFMRLLATSYFFIVSKMNEPQIRGAFENAFNEGNFLFESHSFTQTSFAYMMDFVFISYMQSITLLNVRPENPKYLDMSDSDWLKQLLLPQEGEKMSLVEKLSLILRPAVLGSVGLSFSGMTQPLVEKDGKLVFSPNLREVFRVSNLNWQEESATSKLSHETGLGCPAAFCPPGSAQSSLSIFNEVLVHVFDHIDEIGITSENVYNPNLESVYKKGDQLTQSLKYENQP